MTSATMEKKAAPVTTGDESVRMYPCNQLKSQVRDPKDTFSAFTAMKAFFRPSA